MRSSLTSLLRFRALLLGLLTLGLVACEPNEEPEPCEPTPANAGFKVYEVFDRPHTTPLYVEVDTAAPFSYVSFRPDNMNQARFSWFIGTDTRNFKTPTVNLQFPNPIAAISISLTTQKSSECDGAPSRDSVYRSNVLAISNWDKNSILGYYQGATSLAPNDTFTFRLLNLPRCMGCDSIFIAESIIPGFRVTNGAIVVDFGASKYGYKQYANNFAYRVGSPLNRKSIWVHFRLVYPVVGGYNLFCTVLEDLGNVATDPPWSKTRTFTISARKLP